MGRALLVILFGTLGCAPDQGSGPNPDAARDDSGGRDADLPDGAPDVAADGACSAASCRSRCADAGFPAGACAPSGACICSSGDGGTACDPASCRSRCSDAGYPSGTCSATGACMCSGGDAGTPGGAGERCDDQIDNNGNGAVDEGCGCNPGTTQPCYAGPIETRGNGVCRDGTQPCTGEGEFSHWGECDGAVVPGTETCNGLDDDCDLVVDEGCTGSCVPTEFAAETTCDDGQDNECDGLADCFDPDCPPCCTAESCGDAVDNDCDGETDEDCGGPCVPDEFGWSGTECRDGNDNDCDGRTDCLDLDCLPFCCSPESCADGTDNDCDGRTDCSDTDCCAVAACRGSSVCGSTCCVPGQFRYCDTPSYCAWGRQQCTPDGRWGSCEETSSRPEGCSSGYFYSTSCCVSAGACCQNYGRWEPSLPSDASVGSCGGIVDVCP